MARTFEAKARDFLAQKRIAVAGASRDRNGTGNALYRALRDRGYQVFAINPNAKEIEGDACYESVQGIPGGVDGVLIVTNPSLTGRVARDCVDAKVPRVWMHNNTFMGSSVSEEGVKLCEENGVSVIAGGCPMMFLDFGHKCMKFVLGAMGRLPV